MKEFTAIFDYYENGIGYFHTVRLNGFDLVKDNLVIEYPPANIQDGEIISFMANIRFEEIEIIKGALIARTTNEHEVVA